MSSRGHVNSAFERATAAIERVETNRQVMSLLDARTAAVQGQARDRRADGVHLRLVARQTRAALAKTLTAVRSRPRRRDLPAWRPRDREKSAALDLRRDALHDLYAATRTSSARDDLMASYDGFARSLALRYRHQDSVDDLHQVARIGLLHAIDRFDPGLGRPFPLFARLTIDGELKRHLRDKTWAVRVPRSLKEDYLRVMRAVDDLTAAHSQSPSMAALAEHCGLALERVIEAVDLRLNRRALSIDLPAGRSEPEGAVLDIREDDVGFDRLDNRELLRDLLGRLPERDRRIVELRFIQEMTQSEIATEVGVSQMCVSRVLARTLGKLRVWARAATS